MKKNIVIIKEVDEHGNETVQQLEKGEEISIGDVEKDKNEGSSITKELSIFNVLNIIYALALLIHIIENILFRLAAVVGVKIFTFSFGNVVVVINPIIVLLLVLLSAPLSKKIVISLRKK